MTKLCAEAIGMEYTVGWNGNYLDSVYSLRCYTKDEMAAGGIDYGQRYWPLDKDAQAMALVKRFRLQIDPYDDQWNVACVDKSAAIREDLNRAIVECVANLAKTPAPPLP